MVFETGVEGGLSVTVLGYNGKGERGRNVVIIYMQGSLEIDLVKGLSV